jgi:4-hydroxy-tetrahydrodipicolinate synthase
LGNRFLPSSGAMGEIRGLFTAMVTPFRADGSVNDEAGVALARHLVEHGSHGLVVCGTTGEATTLSDEEHVDFVRTIASELGDEYPIFAGAGSNDTRHAAHLTEAVVEAGAQAVLSVTPYYNKPNRRGLVAHFGEVARAASGRPVILYNIPSRTALNMPPDLLAELAQIDGIAAVKQSNGAELGPIDGLSVLTGNDEDYLRALELGCNGLISVAAHVVGDEMRRMFEEPESRAEIDASLRDVYDVLFCTASPIPVKAALNMMGHDAGGLRLPLVEASDEERARIEAVLARHSLIGAPTG